MSSLLEVPLTRRMHRLPVVRLVHGRAAQRAWSWDLRDQLTGEWWPQGITWAGERLLVSWYSRRGAGSRVSVVDLVARRYSDRSQHLAAQGVADDWTEVESMD